VPDNLKTTGYDFLESKLVCAHILAHRCVGNWDPDSSYPSIGQTRVQPKPKKSLQSSIHNEDDTLETLVVDESGVDNEQQDRVVSSDEDEALTEKNSTTGKLQLMIGFIC